METIQSLNAWLDQSYRFQIANCDCVAGALWFVSVLILVEVPRIMRWIGRMCDAYKI